MNNRLIAAAFCLGLTSFGVSQAASSDAKPTAAAPVAAASAVQSRAAVHASKERSTLMGACQKQASDRGLNDVERKTFLASCLNSKP